MSTPSTKPAAAYVRMSTDHQRYSIANQMAAIEAYCVGNGYALTRIYSDLGKSGLTIDGRPGLKSLVADARSDVFPYVAVIVLVVSRWGRFQNIDEAGWLEHLMRRAGAPVHYCAEAFDNDCSPGAAMVKAIKRAMAAEFSRELSRKVAAGGRRVAANGWRPGSAAGFGYRRVIVADNGTVIQRAEAGDRKALFNGRTTLELGPDSEVGAVRRMFHLYVRRGLTFKQIGAVLAAEGWPSSASGTFCASSVSFILGNEKYAGTLIYGKLPNHLRTGCTRAAKADWTVYEGAHPPIVSMALFRAAQARRKRNCHSASRDELIVGLRRLQAKYGVVSGSIIRASNAVPSTWKFIEVFGSLKDAYSAAGLPDITLAQRRSAVLQLKSAASARRSVGRS